MLRRRLTSALSLATLSLATLSLVGLPPAAAQSDAPDGEPEAAEAKTVEVQADDLTLTVPDTWKQTPPASRLRLAQFAVPKPDGVTDETEVTVFGGFGGSDQDNLSRWVNQFAADGREAKVVQGTSREGKYKLLDAGGTYNAPVGPPMMGRTEPQPDSRMLAAIIAVPGGGNYFLKMAGPKKTIDAQAAAFRASFGADPKTEEKFDLE